MSRVLDAALVVLAESAAKSVQAVDGDLGLPNQQFVARLKDVVNRHIPGQSKAETIKFVKQLHLCDLYLASACAVPTDSSWNVFRSRYRKYLDDVCRYIHGPTEGLELAENIFIDLFLPDRSGNSRIGSYDGRSALATWLRVIIGNRSTNEKLRRFSSDLRLSAVREIVDKEAHLNIETTISARRYGRVVQDCLYRAREVLSDRECLILLWRYEHNLRLGHVAKLLGVHQSTVTRQVERALKRFREQVIVLLRGEGLSEAAVIECVDVIARDLCGSFSIISLLKEDAPALGQHQFWHE
jgi:RNA polymerase sigma factor (sigma-70 family)